MKMNQSGFVETVQNRFASNAYFTRNFRSELFAETTAKCAIEKLLNTLKLNENARDDVKEDRFLARTRTRE
jgi:hypothetical protein